MKRVIYILLCLFEMVLIKNIQIQQLPLTVEDATGEIIAQGGFKLEDFEVKANTSKPWTFIFPKSLVTKEQPDLSTWKVQPPK